MMDNFLERTTEGCVDSGVGSRVSWREITEDSGLVSSCSERPSIGDTYPIGIIYTNGTLPTSPDEINERQDNIHMEGTTNTISQ